MTEVKWYATHKQQVKPCSAPQPGDDPHTSPTDERQVQVLTACFSSSPDCGENADNRIRSVVHISGYICGLCELGWVVPNVGERVRDGGSPKEG